MHVIPSSLCYYLSAPHHHVQLNQMTRTYNAGVQQLIKEKDPEGKRIMPVRAWGRPWHLMQCECCNHDSGSHVHALELKCHSSPHMRVSTSCALQL